MDEMESIKDADGIVASIVFQLITTDVTSRFSKNGGNPLGLDGKGPLNCTSLTALCAFSLLII